MEEFVAPTPTVPADSSPTAASDITVPPPTLSQREQIRIEFYKTYDVMTGVRIAATLGGFFGLMVLLVVYKSKCKSRSLSDEHLEAAVAAAVIEEEEELALNALNLYGPRRSLGNMSAPAPIGAYPRFSSLGGCSLLNPPMRLCYGQRARVSLPVVEPPTKFTRSPVPKNRLTLVSSPADNTYNEEEEEDDDYPANFLQVPSRRTSRRLSSITCSSSDTSYLERRGSAVEMGLPAAPPMQRHHFPHESWDFYYPIDIQVIQPTPILSPCGSEGTLYDRPVAVASTSPVATGSGLSVPKMAPLASISSCAVSASSDVECKSIASDCRSIGSDSVFLDEDCIDTEDEAEEFSTDSENDINSSHHYGNNRIYGNHSDLCETPSVPFAEHLQMCRYPRTLAGRWHNVSGAVCRRYSSPSSHKADKTARRPNGNDEQFPSCSKSCDMFVDRKVYLRPPIPLPQSDDDDDTLSDSDTINNEQQQLREQDDNSKRQQQQFTENQQSQSRQYDKEETEEDKTVEAISSTRSSNVFTTKEEVEEEKEDDAGEITDEVKIPKIAQSEFSELSLVQSQPITSASCDHLVKALTEKSKILSGSMKDIVEHCSSWSQETLF